MTRLFARPLGSPAVLLVVLVVSMILPSRLASASIQPRSVRETAVSAVDASSLVVAFPDVNATEAEASAVLARHGLILEQWLPGLGLARATRQAGAGGAATAAEVSALEADPAIAYVTADRLSVTVADTPQDEFWGQQWGPAKVGLPGARDLTWGDSSVIIAVIDTGVRYRHSDLADQIWINPGESEIDPATGKRTCNTGIAVNGQDDDQNGYTDDCRGFDFDTGSNNPDDVYGHGTAVAGIAGAATNNAGHYTDGKFEGIAGMGGASRIMAVRALNAYGSGSPFNIAEAIRYAADQGAQVINLSLTLPVLYNPDDAATLCRATDYALGTGSLVVAASGNDSKGGIQAVSYPAACPGVLATGASTQQDTRALFSNAGPRLDLIAPGEGIFSTLKATNTSYGLFGNTGSGTSFAAPHAAGAAALVRGLRPDLGAADVVDLLRKTADDVATPGFDNETGWGRLNVARAAANAAAGLELRVMAEPPGVAVGSSTQVRVQLTGPGGAPAGLGARIALTGTLGTVSPAIVTADATGTARAAFTAGAIPGAGSVTASFGSNKVTAPVTISSGVAASIRLSADPAILPANGRATVTASVLDEGGNPVPGALDVTFSTSAGALDPVSAKTTGGKAVTRYDAGASTGVATIHAAAAGLSSSLDVPVLGTGQPFTVTVQANPSSTQAGGPDASIGATVVDSSGKPVPDGTVVTFTTDLGTLKAPSATTKIGFASVSLSPGKVAGTAHVTARAGLVQGTGLLTIASGPVTSLSVSAEPQALVAGYNQLAEITAMAKDQFGNMASDGTVIQFSTTLGQLVAGSSPVEGGQSRVQLAGGLVAGTAEVTATAPGGAHASTNVVVKPAAPAQLSFAAQPLELTVGGGASRLRATVKDGYGNLIGNGVPVTFTTDLGQLQPAGGGSGGLSLVVATNAGVGEADLVPGTVAGVANVQAAIGTDLQQALHVTVHAAGAAQLLLSAQPLLVRPGGRVDIAAHVLDQYGNPVADGINVTFGVNRGQMYQSVVPTKDGVAYTWFTAPPTPGLVQVVGVSGGVSGQPLSVQVARFLYLPSIIR